MDREKVLDFTRRISQCNKSGLTLITYEILFAYLEDAEKAHREANRQQFKENIREASNCIEQLIGTLNFDYEIAKNLYPIYQFSKEQLAMTLIKNDLSGIQQAKRLLQKLYEGFQEASIEDVSLPLMQNSEKVVAGMTYQKDHLSEHSMIGEESRGFLA